MTTADGNRTSDGELEHPGSMALAWDPLRVATSMARRID